MLTLKQKQINGGKMKKVLISLVVLILFTACEELPIPAQVGFISMKPLLEISVPSIVAENTTDNSDLENPITESIIATPVPVEGLYEPALSIPGGNDISKKQIVINKIRKITLKKRNKTLNLRDYSATQMHSVGENIYNRLTFRYSEGTNCNEYSIPEIAQMAFLSAGGPRRDTLLLESDGDGFACAWVPIR